MQSLHPKNGSRLPSRLATFPNDMTRFALIAWFLAQALVCNAEDSRLICLSAGDQVPEFTAIDDQGNAWKSTDHIGRELVVVYFYPADMTRGCTAQACGFQKRLDEMKSAGITVIGVSGDTPMNHQLFKEAHSLKFPLLSDNDGKVAHAFGVPTREGGEITQVVKGEQKTLVRGVTAQRWTFVIGLDGTIIHKNTKVDAASDCDSVLKIVGQLTASNP
jgi:thioredoxin-dependent peroxiredoxin